MFEADHRKGLLDSGVATEDQLAEIRGELKVIIDEAVRFAEEAPEPPLDELYTDVYADSSADR